MSETWADAELKNFESQESFKVLREGVKGLCRNIKAADYSYDEAVAWIRATLPENMANLYILWCDDVYCGETPTKQEEGYDLH